MKQLIKFDFYCKLKSANANSKTNEKKEKVVKTVIYKDDELVHTVVYVK